MNIGGKIKQLRDNSNMSQDALALELGIPQSKLQRIEKNNANKIDFLLMDKICKYFDKDFSYFMNDNVINNNITNNKGQVNCGDNYTIHNNYPESIITEIQNLINENKTLKAKISKFERK